MTIVKSDHPQDATDWADVTAPGANLTQIEEKFSRLWTQIGQTLACKSSLLALEPINEPPANSEADYAEISKLNDVDVAPNVERRSWSCRSLWQSQRVR